MSGAWLLMRFESNGNRPPVYRGVDIHSEESPTPGFGKFFAVVLSVNAPTYAEARTLILETCRRTPWLGWVLHHLRTPR